MLVEPRPPDRAALLPGCSISAASAFQRRRAPGPRWPRPWPRVKSDNGARIRHPPHAQNDAFVGPFHDASYTAARAGCRNPQALPRSCRRSIHADRAPATAAPAPQDASRHRRHRTRPSGLPRAIASRPARKCRDVRRAARATPPARCLAPSENSADAQRRARAAAHESEMTPHARASAIRSGPAAGHGDAMRPDTMPSSARSRRRTVPERDRQRRVERQRP